MSVVNTNIIPYRLIANGISLDLFNDETIKISNNITELFDISLLPSDLTQDITLPGSKINNQFFEHYYDISILSPTSFTTNKKIDCYLDFNGIYLTQGYLKLNSVSLIDNYIESYNITIYGQLSLFGMIINNGYLNDLTSLNVYNHSLTFDNINNSWDYTLFNGDIVYPLADYGQKIYYTNDIDGYGIDEVTGALALQDFKPSIRIKKVFDAIFNEAGYTYESTFLDSGIFDNLYLLLNKTKRYPILENYVLEDYGNIKISPTIDAQDIVLVENTNNVLYYDNKEIDNNSFLSGSGSGLTYTVNKNTKISGEFNLKFKLTSTGGGDNGIPHFSLIIKKVGYPSYITVPFTTINKYFDDIRSVNVFNGDLTSTQEYTLLETFTTDVVSAGDYNFFIKYVNSGGTSFSITLDPDGSLESYLYIKKMINQGDNETIIISENMPFGENGIKQLDFIKGLQQKYNLIIYPHKTKLKHFVIETFNNWYNKGTIKNFNNFIDLNKKIEVIPANNLAVNKLTFGDKLDSDYISKQFESLNNRVFGTETFTDDNNFYSQGELNVEGIFSTSPLVRLNKSGVLGAPEIKNYKISVDQDIYSRTQYYGRPGTQVMKYYHKFLIKLYNIYDINIVNNDTNFNINIKFKRVDSENNITYYTSDVIFPNGVSEIWVEYYYGGWPEYYTDTVNCINTLPSNISVISTSVITSCI